MTTPMRTGASLLLAIFAFALLATGCSKDAKLVDSPADTLAAAFNGCVACHTDQAMLQATAEPDVAPPPSTGEG